MKVRAAKKLLSEGLHTRRIRAHIDYLDRYLPDWPFRSLLAFQKAAFVRIGEGDSWKYMLADVGRQGLWPELISNVLEELSREGPLGELHTFSDYVEMDPRVQSGNPVIRGTRIETQFVDALRKRGVNPKTIAETYGLDQRDVVGALEFSRLAA